MQKQFNLPPDLGANQTLFVTAGSFAAVLVTRQGKRHRRRTLRFRDFYAALTWCIEQRANMVYLAAPPPARN